jgi:hypothetical protein
MTALGVGNSSAPAHHGEPAPDAGDGWSARTSGRARSVVAARKTRQGFCLPHQEEGGEAEALDRGQLPISTVIAFLRLPAKSVTVPDRRQLQRQKYLRE